MFKNRAEDLYFTKDEFLTLLRALRDDGEEGDAILFLKGTDIFTDLAEKGRKYLLFPNDWDVSDIGVEPLTAWVVLGQLWLRRFPTFPTSADFVRGDRISRFTQYLFSLCSDKEGNEDGSHFIVPKVVAEASGLENGNFRCRDCTAEPCLRHPDLVVWSCNPAVFRHVTLYFAEGLEKSLSEYKPEYAVYHWCFDGFGLYPERMPQLNLRGFLRTLCVAVGCEEAMHFDFRKNALFYFAVACREVSRKWKGCEKVQDVMETVGGIICEAVESETYAVSPWPYSSFSEMAVREIAKQISARFLSRAYEVVKKSN